MDEPGLESFQPPPMGKLMPFKKEDDISKSDKRSAVQQSSTQNDPTTTEAASTTHNDRTTTVDSFSAKNSHKNK
uniref:Uncharacterized protein n=1 Tax=Panagrolaimus sp. ES5 TaxID=591445 RepID=A0AC34FM09_9BILA